MKELVTGELIDETIMMKRRKRRRKLSRIKFKMSKSKFIMVVLTTAATTMICCCLALKLAHANVEKSSDLFVEKARQSVQPIALTRAEEVIEDRSSIDRETEAEAELEEEEELNWRQKFQAGSNLNSNSNSNLKQLNKRHASASFGGHSLFETSGISSRIKQFSQQQSRRRQRTQLKLEEQPPNELVFSNETGAVAQCGVAIELAKSIALAEANKQTTNPATSSGGQQFGGGQLANGASSSLKSALDIQVRWERSETGEQVEQVVYGTSSASLNGGDNNNEINGNFKQQKPPLRFIRNSDKALVFEPFKGQDFRPDVHATTYRCVAFSKSRGASIVSRDMRVRATLPALSTSTLTNQAQLIGQITSGATNQLSSPSATLNSPNNANQFIQLEVLDELVVEGNSALLKCLIPSYAQEYLQVVDWIEYPSENLLSFQSTTLANANHLFAHPASKIQQKHNVHRRQQQQSQEQQQQLVSTNKTSIGRYFVSPKSGDLHIVNVDISLSNRYYKCRCKNKLTGELITSTNKGKLIVSESHSLVAPRIIAETTPLSSAQAAYFEGELAMLSCNVQAFSHAQISWFKRFNEHQSEPIENDNTKYVQLASLLLINQVNRNDSGVYLCSVKNPIGEERLELELQVRAPLKAQLHASSNVLELGKSLALECSVTGYPIHQVVFKHNQNVIKSISGSVGATMSHPDLASSSSSSAYLKRRQQRPHPSGNYFVVDESATAGLLNSDKTSTNLVVDKSKLTPFDGADDSGRSGFSADSNNDALNSPPANSDDNSAAASDENSSVDGGDDYEIANQIKLSHVIVIVLEPQHAGSYQCFAYNQYESVQSSTYIRVLDDPPKFKDTFKSEVFEQNQDISLQCSARANPLPEITWSIDEQPIPESVRTRFGDFVTKENLVISYVNISQTQVVDSGLYKCTADNGLAQVSHQAQISVFGAVQVKPMENVTVLASTSFRIRCPVAGFPVTDIQWQHNGHRLPTNHRQRVFENGTIEVEHMEKSQGDEGEYTCIARGPIDVPGAVAAADQLQSLSQSQQQQQQQQQQQTQQQQQQLKTAYGSVFVSIKVKPTIEPFTISRSLREGQRASVMCTISSGDLPISISWFRNDQPLLESSQASTFVDNGGVQNEQLLAPITPQVASSQLQLQVENSSSNSSNGSLLSGVRISRVSDYSSTLLFESLLAQHSANYTCLARNQAGQVSHQAPMIVQVAPKWSIEPADANVIRGSSASIDCMASGFPPPRIVWTKATSSPDAATSSSTLLSSSSTSSLSASSSSFASSSPSSSSTSTIQQKPQSSLYSPSVQSLVNNKDGIKEPTSSLVRSHHIGSWRSIVSSPHLQVHENGSLNILDARDSDLGYYMCQASNGVGPGLSKVIKVTINVAAQFSSRHSIQYVVKGEPTHLKCQAKGDWPLGVHWFKNKDHLEPINVRDSSTTTTSTTTSAQHQQQQQQPSSSSNTLLSSSVASILLVPNAGSATTFFHNLPAHNKSKIGSFLDQLNALILSSSSSSSSSSSASSAVSTSLVPSSLSIAATSSADNLLEATKQQHGSGGATQLMQKYTLNTNEFVPLNSGSHITELMKQSSLSSFSSNLFEFNQQLPGKSMAMLFNQQQPVVVQVNSVLSIAQTERQDTGTFKCFAANYYGHDERTIQLIVQEKPERIEDFSVLEVNSRSITLGWLIPFDGNTQITNYHIQYKPIVVVASTSTTMTNNFPSQPMISQLTSTTISSSNAASLTSRPKLGTSSQMSLEALNSLGWFNYTLPASSTSIGSSSGGNYEHDSNSSLNNQVVISYNFNQQQQQQALFGENSAATRAQQLLTSTRPSGGSKSLVRITISSLKPVTLYWFRVAPENKLGLGSFSSVIESQTLEEAPGAAPSKLKAVAQSSSSILVSWFKLNEKEVFGPVQGYYVAYKALPDSNQETNSNNGTTKQQQQHYYQSNDPNQSGVAEQLQQSNGDFSFNNPVMNIYKTIQHDDKLNKFDALLTGLKRSSKYLISVQAFNSRGTGPSTEPVLVKTLEMDPPKQVKLFVKQATNCTIQLEWRPISQAALLQLQLLQDKPSSSSISTTGVAKSVIPVTSGLNKNAASILPLAMPLQSTFLSKIGESQQKDTTTTTTTTSSMTSNLDVVDYYSLYQAELNDRPRWQEIRLPGHASSHTIENLRCGTRYQFYMIGVNKIGVGDQSDILDTKTVGGLPLAPDRQSTFDVVNTTCYIIRLDHWQNNGCQLREFNIRYKPDLASVRDWTQLAHFNLIPQSASEEDDSYEDYKSIDNNSAKLGPIVDEQQIQSASSRGQLVDLEQHAGKQTSSSTATSGNSQSQLLKKAFVDEDWLQNSSRFKRSPTAIESTSSKSNPLEDVYLFSVDDNPSRSDYEDSFFDYSSDSGANLDSVDYGSVESGLNLSQQQPDNGQNNKLFNLLKDSMIPTFDSSELMQSRLEHLSGLDSSKSLPSIAQEWQASNFVQNKPSELGKETNLQQQLIKTKQDNVNSRTAHATKIVSNNPSSRTVVSSSQQDWRRVKLCNLVENIYYTVQITALNLVGETEAELRLLTSQEGLEYDQDIKRQVVGKLGVDRIAQQSLSSIGDRFNIFGNFNQWPGSILLPATLMITLITILIIITLLLKRSNSPGSTSTTTTTMSSSSGSSSHCQNYLDSESNHRHLHHHHNHNHRTLSRHLPDGGFRGTESEIGTTNEIDGYTLSGCQNAISDHNFTGNNNNVGAANLSIYQQRGSIDEPAYGSIVNRLINPASSSSYNGDTNRSTSSPATTTAATTSMNSGSTGNHNINGGHLNHTIYLKSDGLSGTTSGNGINQDSNNTARGRSVYLCSNGAKDETLLSSKSQDTPIFYGITSNIPPVGIYGTQQGNIQVRHYQQQEANQQNLFQQQPNLPETKLYAGTSSNNSPQHEQNNPDSTNEKMDNCFLNIVEEVARANDNLQQQQQQRANAAQFIKNSSFNASANQQQTELNQLDQSIHPCNPIDCFNQQHFHLSAPVQPNNNSNYASPGEDIRKNDANADLSNGQNAQPNNRLMFDPVYATIRRTFPQAFRYLTLQQHNNHHNFHQQQVISPVMNDTSSNMNLSRQLAFDQQQHQQNSSSTPDNQQFIDNFANKRQQFFTDSQTGQQNMPLFCNSNNLAALNLLVPTNSNSTTFQSINGAIIQQPPNSNTNIINNNGNNQQ